MLELLSLVQPSQVWEVRRRLKPSPTTEASHKKRKERDRMKRRGGSSRIQIEKNASRHTVA